MVKNLHFHHRGKELRSCMMRGSAKKKKKKKKVKIKETWKQCQTLFFWAPKSLQMVTAAMKLKDAYSLEGKLWPT